MLTFIEIERAINSLETLQIKVEEIERRELYLKENISDNSKKLIQEEIVKLKEEYNSLYNKIKVLIQ